MSHDQPPPPEGNIRYINAQRKRDKDGLSKFEKINIILDVLLEKPAALIAYPEFPRHFSVLRDAEGHHRFLERFPDDVVTLVSWQAIKDAVTNYVYALLPSKDLSRKDVWLSSKDVDEVIDKWAAVSVGLKELPVAFRQKSEAGLTFSRLPFDFDLSGQFCDCPVSHGLLNRLGGDNWEALAAWIGSLFDPKSDCHQYVWIYGEGANGKSTLGWLIEKVMGPAYISTYAPMRNDKFWEKSLLGKRVVAFPDCNDYRFVTSGRFKSLTGGDQVKIEGKGKDAYSARLDAKCLFFSNAAPSIKGTAADIRRAIFCRAKARTPEDHVDNFRGALWSEAAVFFGACISYYQNNYGASRYPITVKKDQVDDLIADNEEWMETLFHTFFVVSPGGKVPGTVLRKIYSDERLDNHRINEFKEWMRRNCGVSVKRVGSHKQTIYNGLARKCLAAECMADGTVYENVGGHKGHKEDTSK
jgi:hypothetical protein